MLGEGKYMFSERKARSVEDNARLSKATITQESLVDDDAKVTPMRPFLSSY